MTETSSGKSLSPDSPLSQSTSSLTETESPPAYDSEALLQGTREVIIRHHGEVYRLRLTRNDKLILHK